MILALLFGITQILGLSTPFSANTLSKLEPHRFDYNNKNICVWWDNKQGKWNAINDMCPHRQAALSSGVISRDGNIKCGYHGWEYDGTGTNKLVPQLGCPIDCNIRDFKVIDKYDILWFVEDIDTDTPQIDILDQNNIIKYCSFDYVNLDYRLMIEQALDVSHLNHVHHGTLPLDRYSIYSNEGWKSKNLLTLDYYNHNGFKMLFTNTNSSMTFDGNIPMNVLLSVDSMNLLVYIYPINNDSYRSLSIIYAEVDNDVLRNILNSLVKMLRPLITQYINSIFGEDIIQITSQQYNIRENGKSYNLASQADKPIAYYIRWLKEFGETS